MIKTLTQLFKTQMPANDDTPIDLRVRAVLRAVKYKDMTVEAGATALLSSIEQNEEQLRSAFDRAYNELKRELQFYRTVQP